MSIRDILKYDILSILMQHTNLSTQTDISNHVIRLMRARDEEAPHPDVMESRIKDFLEENRKLPYRDEFVIFYVGNGHPYWVLFTSKEAADKFDPLYDYRRASATAGMISYLKRTMTQASNAAGMTELMLLNYESDTPSNRAVRLVINLAKTTADSFEIMLEVLNAQSQ